MRDSAAGSFAAQAPSFDAVKAEGLEKSPNVRDAILHNRLGNEVVNTVRITIVSQQRIRGKIQRLDDLYHL